VIFPSEDFISLFERWYEQDVDRLYRYLCYRLGDQAQAEDLTATICERAVRNLSRYDSLQATFGAWMFGIARNEMLHWLRDRQRRPPPVSLDTLPNLEADGATVEEQAHRADLTRQALMHLSALSDREQEIIALRYGADMTSGEIARLMNLSPNNIRVMLHRAIEKLQVLLVDKNEAENA